MKCSEDGALNIMTYSYFIVLILICLFKSLFEGIVQDRSSTAIVCDSEDSRSVRLLVNNEQINYKQPTLNMYV